MNNFVTTKITVPIDKIRPNVFNPHYMTPAQFEKEKESIEKLGMIGSIFVGEYGEDFVILDGEHRWKVCKELGYTELPVENIGPVTESQIKFYTVHMNNTIGQDDILKRAALLSAMDSGQLMLLPFTEEQIQNEKKFVEFDFSQYDVQLEPKERKFGMVVVMPMTSEEGMVWNNVKQTLIERGKIDTDNSKKRQDIQTLMYLCENMLNVFEGGTAGERVREIQS